MTNDPDRHGSPWALLGPPDRVEKKILLRHSQAGFYHFAHEQNLLNFSSFLHRAWTMSPEQSQYIWRKTIPHIEVGMGSGVFTSHRSARFVLISD